jgi:DNA-binding MarR family transcriptional regulator
MARMPGPLEARVVAVFETHITVSPTRIAALLDTDYQSVSKVLGNLVRRSQVSKAPKCGREVRYFLTPAQRAALFALPVSA